MSYEHDETSIVELIDQCSTYMEATEVDLIKKAYELAKEQHQGQRRKSGEPYISHPDEVALILAQMRMDVDTVCAALLHDVVEDTAATCDELACDFNQEVADLVDGVTKLTNIEVDSLSGQQAQNLRKMFLAMSKDIRVIIIKLADRLHNMRTLSSLAEDRRIFKSRETLDIYAPLANRLGITSIKWELEDLAFFYLEPAKYQQIARMVSDSRPARERYLQEAMQKLEDELTSVGLSGFTISGRPKHLWSIYQKMINKRKDFSDIHDLIALRVITQDVKDCYSVLGCVHALWHPVPGRFKDYIAMPKFNMYKSLHTTVIGPAGRPLEIQIRSIAMHQQAEYGIAAHWLYKESGGSQAKNQGENSLDAQLAWLKRTLEWQDAEGLDPQEYINALKIDLFDDEVFVFTPKGEVMSLKAGATPIDFAYAIHTEVGNHCIGAKVDGMVVPLSHELSMGDRVEILTQKNASPSRDWLNIVKTPSARSKIRSYFSKITRSDDEASGRDMLAKEMRKHGYGISTARSVRAIKEVARTLGYPKEGDLFAAIGTNKLTARQITNKISALLEKANDPSVEAEKRALLSLKTPMTAPRSARLTEKKKQAASQKGIIVQDGEVDMLVHLSRCCNPVVGDDIVGFVTRGRGVSVHRRDCPNCADLTRTPERMIDVRWDTAVASLFQVEVVIEAIDRMRLLGDVTICFSDSGANILSSNTQSNRDGTTQMRFLLELSEISHLDNVLRRAKGIEGVIDARRLKPGEGGRSNKRK